MPAHAPAAGAVPSPAGRTGPLQPAGPRAQASPVGFPPARGAAAAHVAPGDFLRASVVSSWGRDEARHRPAGVSGAGAPVWERGSVRRAL